tara:strand:- start:24 stop:389 length:366 start_codon:yes stop_codon:yes gene_type:complete
MTGWNNLGRPDHIEAFLVTYRTGQWFGWKNLTTDDDKIYANLIVHDGGSKPTEKECTDGLKAMQDTWDLENTGYKDNRKKEYKSVVDQLDQLYHDMTAGKLDATGEWHKSVKAIKDKYPKE